MPLVEFSCPLCGDKKEVLVRSTSEAAAPVCGKCGVPTERRLALVAAAKSGSSSAPSCGSGCGHGFK